MSKAIMVVDDDEKIRNLIGIYLENEGFNVWKCQSGLEALELLNNQSFDLLILDVMMPEMDGIEMCIEVRKRAHIPILMLSAKSEDLDKIQGLTAGADDYLTKPFNPLELLARVKSQLRRYTKYNAQPKSQSEIEVEDLTINTETRSVKVNGREVHLTPKEFDILELLVRNKGIVLSVDKIYEEVWKDPFLKSDNNVMVHITKLRDKIEPNPKRPIYVKTVWGVGYKV